MDKRRIRHGSGGRLVGRLTGLLLGIAVLAGPLATAGFGQSWEGRALIVYENPSDRATRQLSVGAEMVYQILREAGWRVARPLAIARGDSAAVSAAITATFVGSDEDVKLLYVFGHGGQMPDDGSEEADGLDERAIGIRDDDFPVFDPGPGIKWVVYNTCHAEGMWDAPGDPVPDSPYYLFGAADVDGLVHGMMVEHPIDPDAEGAPAGSSFSDVLIRGLLDTGGADTSVPEDDLITFSELTTWMGANYPPPITPGDGPFTTLTSGGLGASVATPTAQNNPFPAALNRVKGFPACDVESVPAAGGTVVLGAALLVAGAIMVRSRVGSASDT